MSDLNPPERSGLVWRWAMSRDGRVAARPAPRFLVPSLTLEIGVLLGLSVLFPFMIHLLPVPEDARLGPRLLPMFYTPLLAALLGRKRSAVLVALGAPWLNWLLTSHPTPRSGIVTTLELLVFVGVVVALLPRSAVRSVLALPAYVAGMAAATVALSLFPALGNGAPGWIWALQAMKMGLPGVGILVLINWLAVRTYPTGGEGNGPMTA